MLRDPTGMLRDGKNIFFPAFLGVGATRLPKQPGTITVLPPGLGIKAG
jgi:hypothetical protein